MKNCNWSEEPNEAGLFPCTNEGCTFAVPRRSIQKNCVPGARPINWAAASARVNFHVAPSVGDHLAKLIKVFGFNSSFCSACSGMIAKMNAWGPEGCREHREEIVARLRKAYGELTWAEWATAIAKAATSGLALKINPLDPFNSLLDEAIRLTVIADSDRGS